MYDPPAVKISEDELELDRSHGIVQVELFTCFNCDEDVEYICSAYCRYCERRKLAAKPRWCAFCCPSWWE